jgi:ribosomal protein S18 acetylase RimI-like enzyme
LASLIGTAFAALAVSEWLVPDASQRPRVLTRNFRIWVNHAIQHGQVWTTHARTGVAVWFPRDTPLPEPADYDRRLEAACGRHVDRFRTLDETFERHHPTKPHHHLAFLAVDQDHRGQGIGSALLDHHHTRLDQARLPAYLEASSVDSYRLYVRHGYRDLGPPLTLPGTDALFWPLWREQPADRQQSIP